MATTLVFPFTVVALAIAQLIGDGCVALFSISLGAKDEKTSNKSVGNATIAGQIVSALLCAIYFRKPKLIKLTNIFIIQRADGLKIICPLCIIISISYSLSYLQGLWI